MHHDKTDRTRGPSIRGICLGRAVGGEPDSALSRSRWMCYNPANEMRSFVTWLVILAAAAALGRAQTSCGVTPNRSIIGTFFDSDGEEYVFRQGSGNAITLTTPNTVALYDEEIVHTYVSSSGSAFNYSVTFSFLDGSGITGMGTISFTLSPDGNSALATDQGINSQQVPYGDTFTITRSGGTATLVPATLNLMGAQGGPPVTDNTSLNLYNCGLGSANWMVTAAGGFLAVSPTNSSLAPGASTTLTLTATPGTLSATNPPAMGTITVSSPTGDFAPATTAVQFVLQSPTDTVTAPPEHGFSSGGREFGGQHGRQ